MVKEWNLLRAVACLSIVLLHSSTQTAGVIGYSSVEKYELIRILLCYATPVFILLSEILLANKYKTSVPTDFFSKRLKFIIGPFVTFAIVDALVVNYIRTNNINVPDKIFNNLIGDFEGYFILVIFQFYIMHYVITRYNISLKKLLPFSFIFMFIHLQVLSWDSPPINEYKPYLIIPFTAWFGYFTLGYLIGENYSKVASFLKEYKWLTILLLIFSIYLISLSYISGVTEVSSKRIDIFPLAVSVCLFIIAWGQFIPNFKIINLVSNYSLGIYLLHWQIQRLISPYIVNLFSKYMNVTAIILLVFIISLVMSIVIIRLFSFFPFGKYLVGNIKRMYNVSSN
ncbi:hypothetical protein OBCHQ24_16335 [Oceanobacillus iheyensis]|nr:hypothetical protein OBCHQ24_16335 [Oceanobacillus iheyensis]